MAPSPVWAPGTVQLQRPACTLPALWSFTLHILRLVFIHELEGSGDLSLVIPPLWESSLKIPAVLWAALASWLLIFVSWTHQHSDCLGLAPLCPSLDSAEIQDNRAHLMWFPFLRDHCLCCQIHRPKIAASYFSTFLVVYGKRVSLAPLCLKAKVCFFFFFLN